MATVLVCSVLFLVLTEGFFFLVIILNLRLHIILFVSFNSRDKRCSAVVQPKPLWILYLQTKHEPFYCPHVVQWQKMSLYSSQIFIWMYYTACDSTVWSVLRKKIILPYLLSAYLIHGCPSRWRQESSLLSWFLYRSLSVLSWNNYKILNLKFSLTF